VSILVNAPTPALLSSVAAGAWCTPAGSSAVFYQVAVAGGSSVLVMAHNNSTQSSVPTSVAGSTLVELVAAPTITLTWT
jgi:hypothetical protein